MIDSIGESHHESRYEPNRVTVQYDALQATRNPAAYKFYLGMLCTIAVYESEGREFHDIPKDAPRIITPEQVGQAFEQISALEDNYAAAYAYNTFGESTKTPEALDRAFDRLRQVPPTKFLFKDPEADFMKEVLPKFRFPQLGRDIAINLARFGKLEKASEVVEWLAVDHVPAQASFAIEVIVKQTSDSKTVVWASNMLASITSRFDCGPILESALTAIAEKQDKNSKE